METRWLSFKHIVCEQADIRHTDQGYDTHQHWWWEHFYICAQIRVQRMVIFSAFMQKAHMRICTDIVYEFMEWRYQNQFNVLMIN